MRTRTIREAAAYFRETDPKTCLTETAIRRLICSGAVPSARVGRKYLVTVEALEAYLSGNCQPQPRRSPQRHGGSSEFFRRREIKLNLYSPL